MPSAELPEYAPLTGITVVSLEQAVAAPFATRQLAELGARVIKIERPGPGDFARHYDSTVNGMSSHFVWLNRSKESVALDVKSDDGSAHLRALVAQADVLVQNLAPGAAERLGLDAATLRAANPTFIHCSISGYGEGGPYEQKKAYDLLVQCEAGLVSITGTETEPVKVGISAADIAAGMYAYTGILTALYHRQATGEGATLHISMLEALGEWMGFPLYYTLTGSPLPRTGARHAAIAPYGPFRCVADERVFLGIQNDREWNTFCHSILEQPRLAEDPAFLTNADRVRNRDQLTATIEVVLAHRTRDDVIAHLDAAGIACAALRDVPGFRLHPQLAARGRWREVDTPVGPVPVLEPPATPVGMRAPMKPIPAVGEHTDTALAVKSAAPQRTPPIGTSLDEWAVQYRPTAEDEKLATRALLDSVAVAIAARNEPMATLTRSLSEAARWATLTHVLDFDDLHMPSTTHISTVCVPATLAVGGTARDYLVGAGVMARLGTALGWRHYKAGWHATTTSGALGAAATAASALGLDAHQTATALALAVPASGGVQRAFGTDAKSLQVGFAVEAGLRAATLAADGAGADASAIDAWASLLAQGPVTLTHLDPSAPAVPDGLAIKMYPCCYAMQRPIAAVRDLVESRGLTAEGIAGIHVTTPACTVTPLIHHRPTTGLQGKFSLEYACATAILDEHSGFDAFTDAAVNRPEAQRLVEATTVRLTPSQGEDLLDGAVHVSLTCAEGITHETELALPPGAPARPPTDTQLAAKLGDCLTGSDLDSGDITWQTGAELLRRHLGIE